MAETLSWLQSYRTGVCARASVVCGLLQPDRQRHRSQRRTAVGLKHDGTAYTDGTAGLVADGTNYKDVSAQ